MDKTLAEMVVQRWRKLPGPSCSAAYPDDLTFLDEGVYLAGSGDGQDFVHWGGGDYELLPPDHIKLQIQTDAMVTYRFSLAKNRIGFKDSEGCEFAYQRVE